MFGVHIKHHVTWRKNRRKQKSLGGRQGKRLISGNSGESLVPVHRVHGADGGVPAAALRQVKCRLAMYGWRSGCCPVLNGAQLL